ncbi:coiled-coil domain-containing protein 33-like [Lytechinus variegatus]|uniref:coiled-coil domain-containing protein 33-like n=1 Tax=Lytechinus variegatus TaxID=7654 RepID=UPI001BB10103|nr:coiled-coil domain-containing protein 33-like [Lytechinus variegatus]
MSLAGDNSFVFSFKLNNVLINVVGSVFVRLTISSPLRKDLLKDVVNQSGESGEEVKGHIFVTDAVTISPESQYGYHSLTKNDVTFYLPKGLCQDGRGKEVILEIAVFDQIENVKLAEASFLIYPRDKKSSHVGPSEEIYQKSGELLLVTTLKEESILVQLGKVKYEASLRLQETPSPIPSTPSPLPSPTMVPTPEPEPLPEEIPDSQPEPPPVTIPEPEPEPVVRQRTPTPPPMPPVVTFDPPKRREPSKPSGMVALPNHEEVVVIIHAASGLTLLQDNSTPRPYVLGKIVPGSSNGKTAAPQAKTPWHSTHSTVDPTLSPVWEDVICCKIPAPESSSTQSDVLTLKIVDQPTRIDISTFELPLSLLEPFHHYHLDLVQAIPLSPSSIHLYVTIYRKLSMLPECGDFSFHGLEVRLVSVDHRLYDAMGCIMAVTKIVPDYQKYRDAFHNHTHLLSVEPLVVEMPVPHPSSFLTATRGKHQGYSQLWLADVSEITQPKWNHSFVFCHERELASMFVSTAAVVVELYDVNSAYDGTRWHPQKPIGLAVVLLDNRVYNALTNDRGKLGVRIPSIPLQMCVLPTRGKQTPSISIALRLLTSRVPDSLPSVSKLDTLPSVDGFASPETPRDLLPPAEPTTGGLNPEPVYSPPTTPLPQPLYDVIVIDTRKKLSLKDDDLPPSDALQNLLDSNPQDRLVQPGEKPTSTKGLIPTRLPPPSDKPQSKEGKSPVSGGQNDQTLLNLIDSQQREIESYRQAMKRMGEEMVQLQDALTRIEADNSRLRQQANMYEDTTRAMVTDAKLEGMSKAEMLEKYVTLKQALSKQVAEAANYREKLLHAQNDLIKHNDREKRYLDQQEALLSQSKLLQERQDKVKKLEQACREQEKALEKMDKALKGKIGKQGVRFKEESQESAALSAENARLKAELEHMKALSASQPRGGSANEAEKLKMQYMLERAESRVSSLERELLGKAKEWGKEKANISLRSDDSLRQRSLPPLPYYDRGKPRQDYTDAYTDRSYGGRRPRLGYGTPTRLSPLY